MSGVLHNLAGSSEALHTTRRAPRRPLALEGLEARQLLSVMQVGTELHIDGTAQNDVQSVSYSPNGPPCVLAMDNGVPSVWCGISLIRVRALAGNDLFENSTGIPSYADMGDGDDVAKLGRGNDTAFGGNGADRLHGKEGMDALLGGAGNDVLDGGEGNDRLHGGRDHDAVYGGMGNDALVGDHGRDRMYGGLGNDFLNGGDGDDLLMGDAGDDKLRGGIGDDSLNGGAGFDAIFGEVGHDTFLLAEHAAGEVLDYNPADDFLI